MGKVIVSPDGTLEVLDSGQPMPRGYRIAKASEINGRPLTRQPTDPVLMLRTDIDPVSWKGNNTKRTVTADGTVVRERKPSLAHMGDWDDPQFHPNGRDRYVDVLRHDGNVASIVLTNGTADLNTESAHGVYVKLKALALGWLRVDQCPLAPIARGVAIGSRVHRFPTRMRRTDQGMPYGGIWAREILDDDVCSAAVPEGGCHHLLTEQAARRAAFARYQDPVLEGYKPEAEKTLADAMKAIATTDEKMSKLLDMNTKLIEAMLADKPRRGRKAQGDAAADD